MKATLGLIADGRTTSTDEDGHGLRVLAFLNEDYLIVRCTEGDLLDFTSLTELLGSDLFEARNNMSTRSHSNELNLDTANPSDSGKFVVHEEVVGLVVEAPLAENDVST